MDTTRTDPLRTLEVLVGAVVALMGVFAVAMLLAMVAGTGSIPGVNAEVCVTASGDAVGVGQSDSTSAGPAGLRDGVTWRSDEVQLCDADPDVSTRALAGAGLVVWIGAPVLFFCLLWRLLRRARRDGVFADRVPGGLRTLGRLLLVWAVLDFVVSGMVDAALVNRMTDGALVLTGEVPWQLVLGGLALLALARVMDQAVGMRHDVEATI
jgi:hypothetical protein